MGILIPMILIIWLLAGLVTGLTLGAIIQKAERVRTDEYLSCVFASLETFQSSRS